MSTSRTTRSGCAEPSVQLNSKMASLQNSMLLGAARMSLATLVDISNSERGQVESLRRGALTSLDCPLELIHSEIEKIELETSLARVILDDDLGVEQQTRASFVLRNLSRGEVARVRLIQNSIVLEAMTYGIRYGRSIALRELCMGALLNLAVHTDNKVSMCHNEVLISTIVDAAEHGCSCALRRKAFKVLENITIDTSLALHLFMSTNLVSALVKGTSLWCVEVAKSAMVIIASLASNIDVGLLIYTDDRIMGRIRALCSPWVGRSTASSLGLTIEDSVIISGGRSWIDVSGDCIRVPEEVRELSISVVMTLACDPELRASIVEHEHEIRECLVDATALGQNKYLRENALGALHNLSYEISFARNLRARSHFVGDMVSAVWSPSNQHMVIAGATPEDSVMVTWTKDLLRNLGINETSQKWMTCMYSLMSVKFVQRLGMRSHLNLLHIDLLRHVAMSTIPSDETQHNENSDVEWSDDDSQLSDEQEI